MGPSVAVALHHGAPLSNDGYAMVYIGSTTAITSKSILNHGENYCNCLNNVVCNDETLAVASGLPRTSRKFKENVPHIDQRQSLSVIFLSLQMFCIGRFSKNDLFILCLLFLLHNHCTRVSFLLSSRVCCVRCRSNTFYSSTSRSQL